MRSFTHTFRCHAPLPSFTRPLSFIATTGIQHVVDASTMIDPLHYLPHSFHSHRLILLLLHDPNNKHHLPSRQPHHQSSSTPSTSTSIFSLATAHAASIDILSHDHDSSLCCFSNKMIRACGSPFFLFFLHSCIPFPLSSFNCIFFFFFRSWGLFSRTIHFRLPFSFPKLVNAMLHSTFPLRPWPSTQPFIPSFHFILRSYSY